MSYGPSTIQQEGRASQIREETNGWPQESRKGQRSKGTKIEIGTTTDKPVKRYRPHTPEQIERNKMMARIRDKRRRENPKVRQYQAEYKKLNSARIYAQEKERRKHRNKDAKHRINHSLRARLARFIKGAGTGSIEGIVGCTRAQLISHFECQFKRGMTWDNYGTHWHIDHIIPCSSFDHKDKRQRNQCWHWTNLRPLEAKKNIQKHSKITEPQMQLLLCATH